MTSHVAPLTFTIPGPPVPNARARRGKGGHWYTPPKTRAYRHYTAHCAIVAKAQWASEHGRPWPTDARYAVTVRCYFGDARARDPDNVRKGILDACRRLLWDDDSHKQIPEGHDYAEIDRANPRAEVVVSIVDAAPVAKPARKRTARRDRAGSEE